MFLNLSLSLKWFISPILTLLAIQDELSNQIAPPSLNFVLRHEHAVYNGSRILFSDVPQSFAPQLHTLQTNHISSHRIAAQYRNHSQINSRLLSTWPPQSQMWDEQVITAPDVSKREVLLELAKMTHNAYYDSPQNKDWYDISPRWNHSFPFGWEPDADGFRGHIFATEDNSTVVLSIKGTSAGWLAGDNGPSVEKDRLNDNLLFSCCCARVGPTWSPVCNCYSKGNKCDIGCLQNALTEESLFYNIATNLYYNVTYLYPNADIWVVGHSLGGALSGLLGATFGVPVVTFEAPGEKMAARRLHLPLPPSLHHITHVFHTADPIPMGVCTGVTSTCAIGGYALESKCHNGKVILYDTVTNHKWTVSVRKHGIKFILDELLSQDWEVPAAAEQTDCVDCYDWEFGDFK